jgi:hypothetical protein
MLRDIAGTYTLEASGLLVHEELSRHEDAKKTGSPMAMSSVSEVTTIGSARQKNAAIWEADRGSNR